MPNHVGNYLEISGKPKLINKLLKQVVITDSESTERHKATIFSCHRVIPRPSDQDDNWYEWNISNWGSKWGAYDITTVEDNWESGFFMLYFNTAWSPITPVIQKLSQQNPKLRITYRYYEGGGDFYGKESYLGGERTYLEEGELSIASCEIKEEAFGEEHHWCNSCSLPYACNGNNELCDKCIEEELKLQDEPTNETEKESD